MSRFARVLACMVLASCAAGPRPPGRSEAALFRDLERQVKSIRAKTCGAADKEAEKIWDKIRASCNRRHEAFDAAEQKRLVKHPFVKLVIANGGLSTQAAAIPKHM